MSLLRQMRMFSFAVKHIQLQKEIIVAKTEQEKFYEQQNRDRATHDQQIKQDRAEQARRDEEESKRNTRYDRDGCGSVDSMM